MALMRYMVGVIFTPAGKPGETPMKIRHVVHSEFPRSQSPEDQAACESEAKHFQQSVQNTLDIVQMTTGVFGTSPAYGTFCDPVHVPDDLLHLP